MGLTDGVVISYIDRIRGGNCSARLVECALNEVDRKESELPDLIDALMQGVETNIDMYQNWSENYPGEASYKDKLREFEEIRSALETGEEVKIDGPFYGVTVPAVN